MTKVENKTKEKCTHNYIHLDSKIDCLGSQCDYTYIMICQKCLEIQEVNYDYDKKET